jgi:NDP-sugar pyrophosphorylase family protein
MRIIVPIAGAISFEGSEYLYPKPLIDIHGKPLIEFVINNLRTIAGNVKFTFVLKDILCSKYNLDYTISLLTPGADIIRLKKETMGATCSVLMAIDKIAPDEETVIVNSDQIFLSNLNDALTFFRDRKSDGGVITFDSVHPRWSFALTDDRGSVLQTAEKKPISRNAIGGFYYFKSFADFSEAAFNSVYNEEMVEGHLFISSVMNQLILDNKTVDAYKIKNDDYVSFYSPQKVNEFERMVVDKIIPL